MGDNTFFPPLNDLEPTRKTLHAYSHAVSVLPRAHAIPHPKWWHISLKVRPDGLVTDSIPLPERGTYALRMDLRTHQVVLQTSEGSSQTVSMQEGLTSTQFGDKLLAATAKLGLQGDYAREKFEGNEPLTYDPEVAGRFFTALINADALFRQHRATLSGEVGPVQLWPHGFDLAFEWYGTRQVEYEEHGQLQTYPSQLNLGFYPGEPEPYFYSNPWPFETEALVDKPLPSRARWFTDGWQGTYLPYADLAAQNQPNEKLLDFASAVHKISSPTLMA